MDVIATPGVRTTNTIPARSATGSGVEPVAAAIDLAEVLTVGDPDEVTGGVVGPVVVRAGEPAAAAETVGDDLCTAMAARVDKGADLAVGARVSSTGTSITVSAL